MSVKVQKGRSGSALCCKSQVNSCLGEEGGSEKIVRLHNESVGGGGGGCHTLETGC